MAKPTPEQMRLFEDMMVDYLTGKLPPDLHKRVDEFVKRVYAQLQSEDKGETWHERSH